MKTFETSTILAEIDTNWEKLLPQIKKDFLSFGIRQEILSSIEKKIAKLKGKIDHKIQFLALEQEQFTILEKEITNYICDVATKIALKLKRTGAPRILCEELKFKIEQLYDSPNTPHVPVPTQTPKIQTSDPKTQQDEFPACAGQTKKGSNCTLNADPSSKWNTGRGTAVTKIMMDPWNSPYCYWHSSDATLRMKFFIFFISSRCMFYSWSSQIND